MLKMIMELWLRLAHPPSRGAQVGPTLSFTVD